jgi:hypothetical protein
LEEIITVLAWRKTNVLVTVLFDRMFALARASNASQRIFVPPRIDEPQFTPGSVPE